MDGDTIVKAGENIMRHDPLLGSLLILLMAVIVALFLWAKSILKDKTSAHQAHLEDVRKYASETEAVRSVIVTNTDQLRANTDATRSLNELVRERLRT